MRNLTSSVDQNRVSGQRAGRLYRLLKILGEGPSPRPRLLKRLKVGMRTFYRDVDLLRECGVEIDTVPDGYALRGSLEDALGSVPFPNPELTFGDVLVLMRGRSASHQKLRRLFDELSR